MTWCLRLVLLLSYAATSSLAVMADLARETLALNEGRVDEAAVLLKARLAADPRDAKAHHLLCRTFYAQDMIDPAIRECEAAVDTAPVSDNFLWLGRAYGAKASRANPFSAFTLARKVVASFEHAVELDPSNIAALRDLGEYYCTAPSIVGGGLAKAQQLASRMMPVSATKGHGLLGQIARKKGDINTAEAEFKRAIEVQRSAAAYIDLAQFYQDRKEYDRSAAAIDAAMRLDRPRGPSAVDAASIFVAEDRSLPQAEQLLREYLASPARTDAAPAFKVHVQLGDLLARRGNASGAALEYSAALALAAEFSPARKALSDTRRVAQTSEAAPVTKVSQDAIP